MLHQEFRQLRRPWMHLGLILSATEDAGERGVVDVSVAAEEIGSRVEQR
jgi:hypothetical protein